MKNKINRKFWIISAIIIVILVGVFSGNKIDSNSELTQPQAVPPPVVKEVKICDSLGASNRNIARCTENYDQQSKELAVIYSINDNMSDNLVKNGARIDALEIVKKVKASSLDVKNLEIKGTYKMKDGFGHTSEQDVIGGSYSSETLAKIDCNNISFKSIFDAADRKWALAAFK